MKLNRTASMAMKWLAAFNLVSSLVVCAFAQKVTITSVLLSACACVEYLFAVVQDGDRKGEGSFV